MKKFNFKAKNWSGVTVKGQLEVDSRIEAIEVLRSNKLVPLSVDQVGANPIVDTFNAVFAKASAKQK